MLELKERCTALIAPRPGRDAAVAAALGVALPGMNRFIQASGMLLARIAPHQVLAMRDQPGLFEELEAALAAEAGVIDLSDARTGVTLRGPGARERLMALLPVDLDSMRQGCCAQTVMSHMAVLVCQVDDAPTYEVQCATSYRGSFLRAFL